MATKKYYFAYKQTIQWNRIFSPNQFRKDWNSFVSNIDLQNPNLISEQDVSLIFDVKTRNLTPDASFPNQIEFSVEGVVSDTPNEKGFYRALLTGGTKIESTEANRKIRTVAGATSKTDIRERPSPGESVSVSLINLRESFIQTLKGQLADDGFTIEPDAIFIDPDPALPGPPTQTVSGITNKPPVVDNPNVKLPSQEVKSLTATSATDAVGQAKSSVSNTTNQVQGAASGAVSQAQGAASGAVSQAQGAASGAVSQAQGAASGAVSQAQGAASGAVSQAQGAASGTLNEAKSSLNKAQDSLNKAQTSVTSTVTSTTDKLNPKGSIPDGLGKDWSSDKFSPQSIAGNTKYVDPKTGTIGSTSTLAKTLGGAALGGGIGAGIGAITGGGQGALIGGLSGGAIGAGASLGGIGGTALAGAGLGGGIGAAVGGGQGALIGGLSGGAIGAGASLGGIGGTALAGAGLGGGIGAAVGGGQGALIGTASGGVIGAAAAKLAKVQNGMPKPKIPKPLNTPRIKTVKIPRPDSTKGAQTLLNLPKSPTFR